jgi:hypothetical protein
MESNKLIGAAALSALISGGGVHLVNSGEATSVNINDCKVFSNHAREHEQHKCAAELNKVLIECKKG